MFPVWFFIILIVLITYLLYITRPTEDNITVMGRNQLRKLQYWFRRS
ncbi:hypothetical protein [Flaviaesturariibacter amylovorans]|uniref:Uncharacterized protein n=1 Tax=Flaviaesturariibacter amylovorans TaxID=1084520 RepID=A0ABP8GVJ8_9BACT